MLNTRRKDQKTPHKEPYLSLSKVHLKITLVITQCTSSIQWAEVNYTVFNTSETKFQLQNLQEESSVRTNTGL